ncbi:MAG: peptidoglycan-binding protein [Pseudomonadota bacterium]
MRFPSVLITLSCLATPALSDRALLIGVDNSVAVANALRVAGFDTVTATSDNADAMRSALSAFLIAAEPGERRILFLAGPTAHDGRATWLLQTEDRGQTDRATVDGVGLSLDAVLATAAEAPGSALVAVGLPEVGDPILSEGLEIGFANPEIPQGVTLIHGPEADIEAIVSGPAITPGASLNQALGALDAVSARGFLPPSFSLLPDGMVPQPVADSRAGALEAWRLAAAEDSVAAYRRYLLNFPDGPNASDARAAIEAIEAEPNRAARLAEGALELDREARRRVQSQLTLLGYEPRGVDGIFGPGSRGAIERFQRAEGFQPTTFLTPDQIDRLGLKATQRQAELEAEAERRRIEAERQDRAVWDATGTAGDEAGLRTYLSRYPDGLFSEEAREQLDAIESEKRAAAEAADTAEWERALSTDNVEGYQVYLEARPDGVFAAEAEARIAALTEDAEIADERAAAQVSEQELGLNSVTRMLLERQLIEMGLDAGTADGNFDDETRRAIRNFQRDRDLAPTGYLSQDTVARLISSFGDSLLQSLR